MYRTFCFVYRRSGSEEPKMLFVKAYGFTQAVAEARKTLKYIDDIADWGCIPARRHLIRHCKDAMIAAYKWSCNW